MEKNLYETFRRRVAYRLDRGAIPDTAWELLLARGHVQDLADGEIDEERIAEFAKPLIFYADLVEQTEAEDERRDAKWEVQPPQSDGYEADRAQTLGEFLELEVEAEPRVLAWRRDCWGLSEPRTPREAYELVEKEDFRDLVSGLEDLTSDASQPSGSLQFYGSEPGQLHNVDFYKGSSLERLKTISEELRAELFPYWTQPEVSWVVVTGKVRRAPICLTAEIDGFSNQHLTYGTINLKVEPWITGDVVLRAYQHLQALVLPRRPRALSERNLAMTRFVMEHLRHVVTGEREGSKAPPKVSWRRLMARWNEEHEEWAFQDERNFSRDCRRTIKAVTRPFDETLLPDDTTIPSLKVTIPEAESGH